MNYIIIIFIWSINYSVTWILEKLDWVYLEYQGDFLHVTVNRDRLNLIIALEQNKTLYSRYVQPCHWKVILPSATFKLKNYPVE